MSNPAEPCQRSVTLAQHQCHVQPSGLEAFGEPLREQAITRGVLTSAPPAGAVPHSQCPLCLQPSPNTWPRRQTARVAVDSLPWAAQNAPSALAPFAPQYKPGTQFQTDDELVRLAGIATTIFTR